MKTKKTTAPAKTKKASVDNRSRKMEPLKSKELKNQRFEMDEDEEEMDPDQMEDNFKAFEENFDSFDDDDDDF